MALTSEQRIAILRLQDEALGLASACMEILARELSPDEPIFSGQESQIAWEALPIFVEHITTHYRQARGSTNSPRSLPRQWVLRRIFRGSASRPNQL